MPTGRQENQYSIPDWGRDFSLPQSAKTVTLLPRSLLSNRDLEGRTEGVKVQRSHRLTPYSLMVTKYTSIPKPYILHTHCICVFCMDLRTNSDYFSIHH